MTPRETREPLAGPIRSVGAVVRRNPGVAALLSRMQTLCSARGIDFFVDRDDANLAPDGVAARALGADPPDLVVALGGDGTLLRAARLVLEKGVPVYGINLGQLGFLTSTAEAEMDEGLTVVLEGKATLDRRFTLQARVQGPDGEPRGPVHYALNDVVIHKGGTSRVTPVDLSVGDGAEHDEIGSFSADGVILATPTGSTAYSLSAGGPIIVPDVDAIVVTAICPHTLAVRPLVVPASERIAVRPLDREQALDLTADGQVVDSLEPGDTVVVERAEHRVALVRMPGYTFFGTMRRKLNWAVRPPARS